MYVVALWKYYAVTVFNKFKSVYNKCIKKFFGFARRDSMSGILMDLSLPSADTVVQNSCVLFANQCIMSSNKIVQWFNAVKVIYGACVFLPLFICLCVFMCICMFFYGHNYV